MRGGTQRCWISLPALANIHGGGFVHFCRYSPYGLALASFGFEPLVRAVPEANTFPGQIRSLPLPNDKTIPSFHTDQCARTAAVGSRADLFFINFRVSPGK